MSVIGCDRSHFVDIHHSLRRNHRLRSTNVRSVLHTQTNYSLITDTLADNFNMTNKSANKSRLVFDKVGMQLIQELSLEAVMIFSFFRIYEA